jgi:hypothetical protein
MNAEESVSRKCRASNRSDEAAGEWRSGLKGSDEVSEVAREDRPDESGKNPLRPSKTPLIGK